MSILKEVKNAIRKKFAWPGGYRLHILMNDGESICTPCAHENFRQIIRSTKVKEPDGWGAAGVFIHWEGEPIMCAHCNKQFLSEYGEAA